VEPVYVKGGVFHPKFILNISANRAQLLLGSGNLGEFGYMRNAELFTEMEARKGNGKGLNEPALVIGEMCAFLKRLVDEGLILGDGAEDIERAVTPWIETGSSADSTSSRSTWLLHSLDRPILDQVADKMAGQPVENIAVLSRYFGSDLTLFERLMDQFACDDIDLYVQPGVSELPTKTAESSAVRSKVQLHQVDFSTEKGRSRDLHAKLIIWKTAEGAYCLSGSPNFTHAALNRAALPYSGDPKGSSGKAASGNVEVGLFQFSTYTDAFDYLLNAPLVQVEAVSWDSFKPGSSEYAPLGDGSPRPLRLVTARHRGRSLILRLARGHIQMKDLREIKILVQALGEKKKGLSPSSMTEDTLFVKDIELKNATATWVEALDSSGAVLTSNKRWVAQEERAHVEGTTFTIEDFEECKEIGGLEGVSEALRRAQKKADKPEWLLAFLRQWNIRAILEADRGSVEEPLAGFGPIEFPQPSSDQPDERNLMKTGVSILVGLASNELMDILRSDYEKKARRGLTSENVSDFSLGFRYYVVYNVIMAHIFQNLLERTDEEQEKRKHGRSNKYLRFANQTGDHLTAYGKFWEETLKQGGDALIRMDTSRRCEEVATNFLVSSFLAHRLGERVCDIFASEGYKARFPPKMPAPEWKGKAYILRDSARRDRERGELESAVELALNCYQSAMETLRLDMSVGSVIEQLTKLLE
jgi:hypothetical protein